MGARVRRSRLTAAADTSPVACAAGKGPRAPACLSPARTRGPQEGAVCLPAKSGGGSALDRPSPSAAVPSHRHPALPPDSHAHWHTGSCPPAVRTSLQATLARPQWDSRRLMSQEVVLLERSLQTTCVGGCVRTHGRTRGFPTCAQPGAPGALLLPTRRPALPSLSCPPLTVQAPGGGSALPPKPRRWPFSRRSVGAKPRRSRAAPAQAVQEAAGRRSAYP